jgi:hypothetical protein
MQEEIWKDIPNYEGIYQASNLGNIRGLDRFNIKGTFVRGRVLKPSKYKGYRNVCLSIDGVQKGYYVHQLVAMAFLKHKPCGYDLVIDHIDHNPSNNNVDNLQIVTNRYNCSKDRNKYSSQYIGVAYNEAKKRFESNIYIEDTGIYLGSFKSELGASNSYNLALQNIHLFNGDKRAFKISLKLKVMEKTSKYNGINFRRRDKKWVARFSFNKKTYFIGCYNDEKTAYKEREKYVRNFTIEEVKEINETYKNKIKSLKNK